MGPGISPQVYHRPSCSAHNDQVLLKIISQCDPHPSAPQKRPYFPFQFGQEVNMSGN